MYLWIVFLVAVTISLITTPLTIQLSRKLGLTDDPKRKHPAILHKKLLPRAGGVPPLLGFLFSIWLITLVVGSFSISKSLIGISLASILVVIIGLLDDKYDLNPYLRLLSNFIVAAIVVGSGIGINFITNPLGGLLHLDTMSFSFHLSESFGLLAGPHTIVLLADVLALIWIVWVMNALNWSSGIDGQLTGIATMTFLILGIASLGLIGLDSNNQRTAIYSFAAAGAFLGFLPFSFFPQKIMPGYGGATLAGFLIATLSILSGAKIATAFLILLVPLLDALWAIVRRLISRHSPVWGDREHLHHQLLKLGLKIPQIWFLYVTATFLLGILALTFDTEEKFFAIIIIGVIVFGFLITSFVALKRLRKLKW